MVLKHSVCVFVCVCMCTHVCLRLCVPNIITSHQGYFPLSGLGVPAGVDWEKIRAYSLDYKRSCKQSHIVAMEKWQRLPACLGRQAAWLECWSLGLEVNWLSGWSGCWGVSFPHSSHTWRTEDWEGFLERETGKTRILSDVACSDGRTIQKDIQSDVSIKTTNWLQHNGRFLNMPLWELKCDLIS